MPPVPSSDREDASEAVAEENAAAAANCSPMDEKEAAKIIAITCAPLERASEREGEDGLRVQEAEQHRSEPL